MGFGKLFIGYVLLFYLPLSGMDLFVDGVASFDIVPNIIGYLFIFSALNTLSLYENVFKKAKICAIISAVFAFINAAIVGGWEILNIIPDGFMQGAGKYIVYGADVLENMALLVFNIFLMKGLSMLADETDMKRIKNRLTFNYFLVIPAILGTIVVRTLALLGFENKTVCALYILFIAIWVLLNSLQIFACYMWICRPEDKDMLPKNSKLKTPFEVAEKTKKRTAERMKNKKKKKR